MITEDLQWFKLRDWKHADIVNTRAAYWLNEVRISFGAEIVVTGDGRPAGEKPSGGVDDSLHYIGQAFDLRSRAWNQRQRWAFLRAVMDVDDRMPLAERGIQLELVQGPTDQHFHLGFYLDGRPSELALALT